MPLHLPGCTPAQVQRVRSLLTVPPLSRLDLAQSGVMTAGQYEGACILNFVSWCFLGGGCLPAMSSRAYLRQKYGIPGSAVGDFMITWCCGE